MAFSCMKESLQCSKSRWNTKLMNINTGMKWECEIVCVLYICTLLMFSFQTKKYSNLYTALESFLKSLFTDVLTIVSVLKIFSWKHPPAHSHWFSSIISSTESTEQGSQTQIPLGPLQVVSFLKRVNGVTQPLKGVLSCTPSDLFD